MTPAMAAGVTDRVWKIGDIVALVEANDAKPKKRGPYKKQAVGISDGNVFWFGPGWTIRAGLKMPRQLYAAGGAKGRLRAASRETARYCSSLP